MTAQILSRPNRYAATCVDCGARIPAGEGLLARTDDGRWAAAHPGDCPERPAPAAASIQRVATDGMYLDDAQVVWKVQQARNGSGRLYAKRLDPTTGRFTYEPGAVNNLRADQRMTLADAAAFGALYGICCRCGRDLTDEDSIARGTGPICAGAFA